MTRNRSVNRLVSRAIPGSKGTNNWFDTNIKFDTPKLNGFSIVVHFGLDDTSTSIIEYTIDNGLTYQKFLNSVAVGINAGIEREITLSGGSNGDITNYADSITSPGSKSTLTSLNHLLQDGDVSEVTDNPDYNGIFIVSNVTLSTFDIVKVFTTNNKIGKFDSADRFNIKSVSAVGINFCRVDIV